MLTFLKYLIQLILAPGHGWEDICKENPDPDRLLRSGLYPLLGVAAATEALALIYDREATVAGVLIHAISDFGAYFIAIFICYNVFIFFLTLHFSGTLNSSFLEINSPARIREEIFLAQEET